MKIRLILLAATLATAAVPTEAQVETRHYECRSGAQSASMVVQVEHFNTHGITQKPSRVIRDGGSATWLEGRVQSTEGNFLFSDRL